MNLKNIIVIGCGTMGSQISVLLAIFGYNVTCITRKKNEIAIKNVKDLVENPFWKRIILRNNYPEIKFSNDPSSCKEADLVIEAITEDFEAKFQLFKDINPFLTNTCLVSTITSTLSIEKLSKSCKNENFIGLHFFNPVNSMKIVELIPSKFTEQIVIVQMSELCVSLGKKVIIAPDEPGFILNKLMTPFWIDCVKYLENTNNSAEKINEVIKQGANLPIGPFETIDLIGIDMFCNGAESLYRQTKDPRYKIPEILIQLRDNNKLGRKTGEGILSYSSNDI